MYRRILVPIDGSSTAQRGLAEAIGLGKAFDATLVLLTVIEPPPPLIGAEISTAAAWDEIAGIYLMRADELLERALDEVRAAGVASEVQREGPTAMRVCDAIVEQARERRCDLIVMGTHGRRGLSHALIGSDAERVLRQAPCAVLLVRSSEPRTRSGC